MAGGNFATVAIYCCSAASNYQTLHSASFLSARLQLLFELHSLVLSNRKSKAGKAQSSAKGSPISAVEKKCSNSKAKSSKRFTRSDRNPWLECLVGLMRIGKEPR